MRRWTLAATALLTMALGPTALAGDVQLPAGLSFCSERSEIDQKLGEVNELTDEMLESNLKLWGLDGVLRVVLEEQKLITARFRVFETPQSLKTIKSKLGKQHGEPIPSGKTDDSGLSRKYTWSPGNSVTVEMSRQTEQVYATWEVPPERCSSGAEKQEGLTDQEKADLESVSKKKAIEFDVFSEDLEEREQEIADEKKRKAEEEERKEKEEAGEEEEEATEDVDIDW
jgi:hypothetical protein